MGKTFKKNNLDLTQRQQCLFTSDTSFRHFDIVFGSLYCLLNSTETTKTVHVVSDRSVYFNHIVKMIHGKTAFISYVLHIWNKLLLQLSVLFRLKLFCLPMPFILFKSELCCTNSKI